MVFRKWCGEVEDNTELALRAGDRDVSEWSSPLKMLPVWEESEEAYIQPLLLRTGQEERVIPRGLKK